MKLYKTLKKGLKSKHGNVKWKLGEWQKCEGELKMCSNGFHCSEKILDAMGYIAPEVIAEVEVRGKHLKQPDKQCWEEMRIVKKWNWTKKDSVSLAIYSAELVLDNFEKEYPDDKRPREAIEAAKKVLRNNTPKNRNAAESAARSAESAASAAKLRWRRRAKAERKASGRGVFPPPGGVWGRVEQ